jgi:hypothetical protein
MGEHDWPENHMPFTHLHKTLDRLGYHYYGDYTVEDQSFVSVIKFHFRCSKFIQQQVYATDYARQSQRLNSHRRQLSLPLS